MTSFEELEAQRRAYREFMGMDLPRDGAPDADPEQTAAVADLQRITDQLPALAALSPLEYELQREARARDMGIRVSVLDRLVDERRPQPESAAQGGASGPFEEVTPAAGPVDGARLLDELVATILRFCVLPAHSAPIVAAWIIHAWAHNAFLISPNMALSSPLKGCGKTTLASLIAALVPRPLHTVNISASVLFRVIDGYSPTVIIDEADTFLGKNDDMRGILNGGHNRRSAYVWRCEGDDHVPRRFNVWAPKVVALIGRLPDTLEDRSLIVHLRRMLRGETVEQWGPDTEDELLPLRQQAARWAADNMAALSKARPAVPGTMRGRAADNARPLCAIADAAGGHWPATIRAALVEAHQQTAEDAPQDAGEMLLRDVHEVFTAGRFERMGSTELIEALHRLEESPWKEWRGRGLSVQGLAKLLRPLGIRPEHSRAGNFYLRASFGDAFARYLGGGDGSQPSHMPPVKVTPIATFTENHNEIKGREGCEGCEGCSGGAGREGIPPSRARGSVLPQCHARPVAVRIEEHDPGSNDPREGLTKAPRKDDKSSHQTDFRWRK